MRQKHIKQARLWVGWLTHASNWLWVEGPKITQMVWVAKIQSYNHTAHRWQVREAARTHQTG